MAGETPDQNLVQEAGEFRIPKLTPLELAEEHYVDVATRIARESKSPEASGEEADAELIEARDAYYALWEQTLPGLSPKEHNDRWANQLHRLGNEAAAEAMRTDEDHNRLNELSKAQKRHAKAIKVGTKDQQEAAAADVQYLRERVYEKDPIYAILRSQSDDPTGADIKKELDEEVERTVEQLHNYYSPASEDETAQPEEIVYAKDTPGLVEEEGDVESPEELHEHQLAQEGERTPDAEQSDEYVPEMEDATAEGPDDGDNSNGDNGGNDKNGGKENGGNGNGELSPEVQQKLAQYKALIHSIASMRAKPAGWTPGLYEPTLENQLRGLDSDIRDLIKIHPDFVPIRYRISQGSRAERAQQSARLLMDMNAFAEQEIQSATADILEKNDQDAEHKRQQFTRKQERLNAEDMAGLRRLIIADIKIEPGELDEGEIETAREGKYLDELKDTWLDLARAQLAEAIANPLSETSVLDAERSYQAIITQILGQDRTLRTGKEREYYIKFQRQLIKDAVHEQREARQDLEQPSRLGRVHRRIRGRWQMFKAGNYFSNLPENLNSRVPRGLKIVAGVGAVAGLSALSLATGIAPIAPGRAAAGRRT